MGLLQLHTNLRSLKFGNDRPGAGSSNQPYEPNALPSLNKQLNNQNTDFLLRGGILAPVNSAVDVVRLGKYFTDTKSPSGLLFTIKQNLLSKTSVRTQASGKIVNNGVYTPLSTLAQAGVNAFGFHFNKQGLNPVPGSLGSLTTYSDVVTNQTPSVLNALDSVLSGGNPLDALSLLKANRLVALHGVKITNEKPIYQANGIFSVALDPVNVLSYPGGPGSILGFGLTNIKFADQRTGLNNPNYGKNPNYQKGLSNSQTKRTSELKIQKPLGVSTVYNQLVFNKTGNKIDDITLLRLKTSLNASSFISQYTAASTVPADVYSITKTNFGTVGDPTTNTQNELLDNLSYRVDTNKLVDFRKKIRDRLKDNNNSQPNILSDSPDYNAFRIENRVNLGDPGNSFGKDLTSYVNGVDGSGSASNNSFDKITVKPLYRSDAPSQEDTNDLVKFRIAAIDNDDPSQKVYIHFRAFLNSMNDAFSADWESHKYTGRGENFYTYNGFDRKFSLTFDVAAQSKKELIPIYKKLNYLASNLAPDYSKFGYMRGALVQLTIGGYLYEQPGFITSLVYDKPEESTWEIGIVDNENSKDKFDGTVKELPHVIKVTSFQFTPIHNFTPRKQQNEYNGSGKFKKITKYGNEHFIALTTGGGNNYDDFDTNINKNK